MANIRVSYGEMEQTAAQLGQGREELIAKLQSLEALIQDLVMSGFATDVASGKFLGAYSEYTAGASVVVARLDDMQNFLLHAAQAIRDMDAQIAASIH